MLIASSRPSRADMEAWQSRERSDHVWAGLRRLAPLVDRAKAALLAFMAAGPFYVGTSWGKDSLVVAHLAHELGLDVPVIWFPAGPVESPDCALVRDAFLRRWPVQYLEHEVADLVWSRDGLYMVHDGAQAAFVRTSKQHGLRYASGVRAQESRARRMRMAHWGECSPNTCAPIGRWTIEDVYAYLALHDLPVHPAYACSWDGAIPRDQLRVSTIGGVLGNGGTMGGNGRREWEARYYPETMRTVRELGERHA